MRGASFRWIEVTLNYTKVLNTNVKGGPSATLPAPGCVHDCAGGGVAAATSLRHKSCVSANGLNRPGAIVVPGNILLLHTGAPPCVRWRHVRIEKPPAVHRGFDRDPGSATAHRYGNSARYGFRTVADGDTVFAAAWYTQSAPVMFVTVIVTDVTARLMDDVLTVH